MSFVHYLIEFEIFFCNSDVYSVFNPSLSLSLFYRELSRFIAAGKLHCKIDKVAGVLETNRPDAKNALYQATIKQGDFLLNRIQKLSRVIDLWSIFHFCFGNGAKICCHFPGIEKNAHGKLLNIRIILAIFSPLFVSEWYIKSVQMWIFVALYWRYVNYECTLHNRFACFLFVNHFLCEIRTFVFCFWEIIKICC